MEIKSLENTPLSEIATCFNHAFSDYFVKIAATEQYLQNRWRANRVDYSLSFGAFEKGKLVAFIIHGIDNPNGKKTAYNAGTGVIPEFRGQKLVAQLYDFALPRLKAAGVMQSTLEVITQNYKAIKAYQNVGFKNTRTLNCFNGSFQVKELSEPSHKNYQLKIDQHFDFNLLQPLHNFNFSWENKDEAVKIIKNDLENWQVFENGNLKGYVILNPATGAIMQLGFENESITPVSNKLFKAISEKIPVVRINNIDSQAHEIVNLLKGYCLKNTIDQYELLLEIQN